MAVHLCEYGQHPFDYAPDSDGVRVDAAWGLGPAATIELYFCSAEHLAAYLYEVRGVDPPAGPPY